MNRFKAALGIAVLGAGMATPTIDQAMASSPAVPDVSAALTQAGISSTNAASIVEELNTLEGVAPGGSLTFGALDAIDNSLITLNGGGLVSGLLTLVASLLTALNPAAPSNITSILGGLEQIGAAPGASSAVQTAVDELSATLRTAGLGQLLTQVSGLSGTQDSSVVSALAALQSLPLGGDVPAGGLQALGTVLSDLGVSSLSGDAALLSGASAISPAQLETVIADLQSAASALPSPLNGVVGALAAQLGDAGSIFGALGSVGNPVSLATISEALAALHSLPGLAAGSAIPGGLLAPIGAILSQLASEPGVPASVATLLDEVAGILDGSVGISPATLQILIDDLEGVVASLPTLLSTLVNDLVTTLEGSGTLLSHTTTAGNGAGSGSGNGSEKAPGSSGHGGHAVIKGVARHRRQLVVTLRCTASADHSCRTILSVAQKGHRTMRETVTFRGGSTKRVRMRLALSAEMAVAHHHRSLRVSARTGSYTARRTIR